MNTHNSNPSRFLNFTAPRSLQFSDRPIPVVETFRRNVSTQFAHIRITPRSPQFPDRPIPPIPPLRC
ncbi:MAG: hypothetical protein VKJ24_12020 [Synechococcales bacterium]|nr:hypothetical protein [Synechococcales bacterium]